MAEQTHNKRNKKQSLTEELTFVEECSEIFSRYSSCLAWVFLFLNFFLIASILTSWTGVIGSIISGYLLYYFGGAILLPFLFGIYICLSEIMGRKVPKLYFETVGTLLLFLCGSFALSIIDLLSKRVASGMTIPSGILSNKALAWSLHHLGPLGTTLVGLMLILATCIAFGVSFSFDPRQVYNKISTLHLWGKKNEKKKIFLEKVNEDISDDQKIFFEGNAHDKNKYAVSPTDVEVLPTIAAVASKVIVNEEEELFEEGDLDINPDANLAFPPSLEIFGLEKIAENAMDVVKARPWGDRIVSSLKEFGIETELAEILVGPTVIQFRIQLAPGIKVSRVSALSNDLALALAVPSVRVEAPIPGKPYIGIEIPNPKRQGITIRTVLSAMEQIDKDIDLPLPMGVTVDGDALIVGLETLPHLLVAGTTGSGKSVFVNSCIVGLCSNRKPSELRLVLVDPKRVEMAAYTKLPHILTPPITDPKKAVHVLSWALREMQERYESFARAGAKNILSYNEKLLPKDRLPYIVIVVDELADLMMTSPKEVEDYICRLAQMARATGIHLLLATQRPSVNVITGLIKANIPARVAFTLPGSADSRTILDCGGAEKLLGKGDMLFMSTQNPKPVRVQAAWIDERGIDTWLNYLIRLFGEAVYIDIEKQGGVSDGINEEADLSDPIFEEAVRLVLTSGMASASGLQRRLRVGFTRAARLIDTMESLGIVGPSEGAKPREILMDEEQVAALIGEKYE